MTAQAPEPVLQTAAVTDFGLTVKADFECIMIARRNSDGKQ